MEEELFGRADIDNTVTEQRSIDPMHPSRLSEPMRWLTTVAGARTPSDPPNNPVGDTTVTTWYTDNATEQGQHSRGWILGHFLDRSQEDSIVITVR